MEPHLRDFIVKNVITLWPKATKQCSAGYLLIAQRARKIPNTLAGKVNIVPQSKHYTCK